MRFEQRLISTQSFLENVGYCRFSAFYSQSRQERGVLVEMVGRLAVAILAAVSCYDLATKSLPLIAKVLVHGTLLAIITSLFLSSVLRIFLPKPAKEIQLVAKDTTSRGSVVDSHVAVISAKTIDAADQASRSTQENSQSKDSASEQNAAENDRNGKVPATPMVSADARPLWRYPASPESPLSSDLRLETESGHSSDSEMPSTALPRVNRSLFDEFDAAIDDQER